MDTLIVAFGYLGWAILILFGILGLLGVAAFLGPRRYDYDDDYRVIVRNGEWPVLDAASDNDNFVAEDVSVSVESRR